jgi:hypothetical protein
MKIPEWLPAFGDLSFRGRCPPESAEQITFFNTLRNTYPEIGKIAIHPRNEGKRSFYQAAKHKAEGMTPGAADIVIPGNPAFVCELKRQDSTQGRWQDGQLEYLQAAQNNGAFVCVAFGHKAALEALKKWMK